MTIIAGDTIARMARELASRHRLWREDGTLCCWRCGARDAGFPSLHCDPCRLEAKAAVVAHQKTITLYGHEYRVASEPSEKHRWRALHRNMQYDARLDREGAMRMLTRARQIPGAFEGDVRQLQYLFERRFGAEPVLQRVRGGYED